MNTKLNRCLGVFDLIMLGVSSTVGAGIFVISGNVMKNIAGPAVVLSFAIASVASLLSGLCYAEFGAKVPKTGSAYIYSYVALGELIAFIIGWNTLLEILIAAASVAKACSGSVDVLLNGSISRFSMETIGHLDVPFMSHYLDLVAFGCVLFCLVFVAIGVKCSSGFINLLSLVNIFVLLLIIGLGLYFANFSYWTDNFFPYGFSGSLAGSATCFYAFVGFECIVIASEEAKNPSKTIPLALGICVLLVTFLYIFSSAALTLLIPYTEVDIAAPFPYALKAHGVTWATRVISLGSVIGLSSTLSATLFGLPRLAYAMASDGLIFGFLGYIHPKTQTPIASIALFGIMASLLALLMSLEFLTELLSIGTLLCYITVSVSVVIVRYQPAASCQFELTTSGDDRSDSATECDKDLVGQNPSDVGRIKKKFSMFTFLERIPVGYVGPIGVGLIVMFASVIWSMVLYGRDFFSTWWMATLFGLSCLGFVSSYLFLYLHQENRSFATFQTPFVPLVPVVSITINIGLMMNLSGWTWLRLLACLLLGILIYFCYGIRHSKESIKFKTYQQLGEDERN